MNGRLFLASKVLVGLIDPISAGRVEDVEIHRVFESLGHVRHVGRDAEHFARVDDNFAAIDAELQCPVKDVSKLLVVMAVLGYDAAFFQQHPRQHNFLTYDELPLQERVQLFERDRVPGDVLELGRARRVLGNGTLSAGVGFRVS